MISCNKQQKEEDKGKSQFRCLHKEADTYLQVIELDVCEGCPLANREVKKTAGTGSTPLLPIIDKRGKVKNQPSLLHSELGYPVCPYRDRKSGSLICTVTGLPVTEEICNKCDKDVRDHSASLGEKFVNYYGAIRKWIAAGRPARTPEEINKLFEEHCKKCDKYDADKHACKNCGCAVSTDSTPLTNKLAMATERCPLGRF